MKQRHEYFRVLFLTVVLAMAFWQGCDRKTNEQQVANGADSENARPPAALPDTSALNVRILKLDSELAVLKTQFQVKEKNLPVKSYYHKNWNYRYYIHDDAMMAGVDESGVFFLIDSYNCSMIRRDNHVVHDRFQGMEVCNFKTSWLELRWPDTTIVVREPTYDLVGKLWPQVKQPIQHDSWIGTGYFCTDYHPIADDFALIRRLADPAVGNFKFYRYCENKGKGDIGSAEKRDRTGIRDCARLSMLITERARLQAEKDSLISSVQ